MSATTKRRIVYSATIIGILALVTGFALATIGLTYTTQNAQGNYVNSSGAVTGLTYTSTVLSSTSSPAPSASSGTAGLPQPLVTNVNAFCVSPTCTAEDFAQIVTYTFTTSMTGSILISIEVSATAGSGATTIYLMQATTAVGGTIVLTWDLGTATNTLNSVTLSAQQCTGAGGACP